VYAKLIAGFRVGLTCDMSGHGSCHHGAAAAAHQVDRLADDALDERDRVPAIRS
jgi:hypothetical protein